MERVSHWVMGNRCLLRAIGKSMIFYTFLIICTFPQAVLARAPSAPPKMGSATLEDLLQAAEEKPTPLRRHPMPDPAAVQKALKMLEEVYKEDIAGAKTPQKKQALAGRLLADALEAQDPAEQFALMQAARQWAVQAGDVAFALRAADALIERFQVDRLALKTEVLEAFSKAGVSFSPVELAEAAEPLIQEAIGQDALELAGRLSRLALKAASRSKNADLIKRLTALGREVEQALKGQQKIQAALDVLRQNPQDAEAHLLVGRYLCFTKGQWTEGLKHLAQSSDQTLRRLAEQDLAGPTEPAKQMALADAWWDRAGQEKDPPAKSAMQARAAHWYEAALPSLSGLDKIKAGRRLQEAQAAAPKTGPAPSTPRHYLDPQNRKNVVVLWWSGGWRGDGSQFLQIEKVPDGGYRLVAHPEPEWVIVAFPKVPLANSRMKLTYTLEKGDCHAVVRNMKLEQHPPRIVLPAGKHTLETWLEKGQMRGLLDGQPVSFERDDPNHYVAYDLSLRGGTIITIHQLEFTPLK